MNKNLNTLIIDLEKIFTERLISVILYGSAAFGEFHDRISDINLLVILSEFNAVDLKNAYPAIKKWKKTGNPLPIFMNKHELFDSCDIYPLEYADIRERHKILYGENFLDKISLDKDDLRLQCERELRNLILKLRQNYLANSNDKKATERMLKKSLSSIIAIFRVILRIQGEEVPCEYREIIELMSLKVSIDKDLYLELLTLRERKSIFSHSKSPETLQKLINSLYTIIEYIDKLNY